MATAPIIEISEEKAVIELKALRVLAEKTSSEIGRELLAWQERLPHGKFKRAYLMAGWTENQVYYYLTVVPNRINKLELDNVKPEVIENNGPMAVHYSSASDEWYTPPEIIERTEKAIGKIDLDPCSPVAPTVPAATTFTKDADGLRFDWCGNVYMNPPYGREINAWVEKLVSEYRAGRTKEAIALVPARVDTDWFQMFGEFAICFIDGRLKFSGHDNSAPFPSAVVYLGTDTAKFAAAFSDIGGIWVRWRG